MSDFIVGEHVNILIEKARIESIDDVGIAVCSLPGHAWRPTINLRADGVELTRIAPPEWPPRHGDLWRDQAGRLWAGMQITTSDDDTADVPYVVLVPLAANLQRRSEDPDQLLQHHGPVTVVFREPNGGGA